MGVIGVNYFVKGVVEKEMKGTRRTGRQWRVKMKVARSTGR